MFADDQITSSLKLTYRQAEAVQGQNQKLGI
jgi:hypothetical protein